MNVSRIAILVLLLPAVLTAQMKQSFSGNACLDLRSGKIMEGAYCLKPDGPIIRGNLFKGGFEPSNTVEFAEMAVPPDPKFVPGWIELRTGAIHYDYEGRGPLAPYLRGRIDPKGYFYVHPEEIKNWGGGSREYTMPDSGSISKSDSSQASIRALEGSSLEVRFKPKEITFEQKVLWNKTNAVGSMAFQSGGVKLLHVELQFEDKSSVYDSYIRQLETFANANNDLRRPPLCDFSWGRNFPHFTGVVENLSIQYTEFLSDGTPVRATVHLPMMQASRLYNETESRQLR